MSRTPLRLLLALVICAVMTPGNIAATGVHPLAKAQLTFGPQIPRVDQPWHVRAEIQSADALQHPSRHVRVIGEMTGHPMLPVEVELTRVPGERDIYEGAVAFTMPGSWRITVRVDDINDTLVGMFGLDVCDEDGATGFDELRSVVDLHQPVRPNLIPPWYVVGAVGLLVVAAEWTSMAAARRRAQRGAPTASA